MGGGGIIIIKPNAVTIQKTVSDADQATMNAIANRSPVKCSRRDAFTMVRLLWKLLRS